MQLKTPSNTSKPTNLAQTSFQPETSATAEVQKQPEIAEIAEDAELVQSDSPGTLLEKAFDQSARNSLKKSPSQPLQVSYNGYASNLRSSQQQPLRLQPAQVKGKVEPNAGQELHRTYKQEIAPYGKYQSNGELTEKGVDRLAELIEEKIPGGLTAQQKQDLTNALKHLSDVLPKTGDNSQILSNLVQLIKSGHLRRLAPGTNLGEQAQSLKKATLMAMLQNPSKADAILNLVADKNFSALDLKGNFGRGTQKALLLGMANGQDMHALLKQPGFLKLKEDAQFHVARKIAQTPSFSPSELPAYQQATGSLYKALNTYKNGNDVDKAFSVTTIAHQLKTHPHLFSLLSPVDQVSTARALLEQLSKAKPPEGDTKGVKDALETIKKTAPDLYKKVIGGAASALQKGTVGWKDFVKDLLNKVPDLAGTLPSNPITGILVGMVGSAVLGGIQGDSAMTQAKNGVINFATGGIGAAIMSTASVSTAAGMGIGFAPAALVAIWNHYCERTVSNMHSNQLQQWMKQPSLAP